jgi:hypothetical protein
VVPVIGQRYCLQTMVGLSTASLRQSAYACAFFAASAFFFFAAVSLLVLAVRAFGEWITGIIGLAGRFPFLGGSIRRASTSTCRFDLNCWVM